MLDHVPTPHTNVRMRQRGLRDADLELVMSSATRVAADAYLMTASDVAREIAERKREIQRLERLRGLKVVVAGDAIVTVYHARPNDRRRTLRKGRESR
jgi:hypothetical protein